MPRPAAGSDGSLEATAMPSRSPDDAPPARDGDASDARDAVEELAEEFFERRRLGDPSDVDDFARRVPGREDEFKRLIATLDVLEAAADASDLAPPPGENRERLGRLPLPRPPRRRRPGARSAAE